MCGIAGIHSQNNVASDLFDCLVHLQHRGQDAAGIMTYDDTHMHKAKGMGLARDVFNEKKMSELQGKVGVAHNRYPTHGGFGHGEIQPFWTNVPYGIALAHNGNITNYSDLVNLISEKDKRYLNTSSDTEVLMNLFADQLHSAKKVNSEEEFFNLLCKSIEYIYENVKGSYSIVGMIVGKGLIAFRDPQGIRPLVYGKRTSKKGSDYIFASENSMFYSLEFEPKGNVLPGELYYISESGKKFKIFSSMNTYYFKLKGSFDDLPIDTSDYVYNLNINSTYRFSDRVFAQFNLNYVSRRLTAQGEDSEFYSPNLTLTHRFGTTN